VIYPHRCIHVGPNICRFSQPWIANTQKEKNGIHSRSVGTFVFLSFFPKQCCVTVACIAVTLYHTCKQPGDDYRRAGDRRALCALWKDLSICRSSGAHACRYPGSCGRGWLLFTLNCFPSSECATVCFFFTC
jgi:hypothetical protein